MRLRPSPLILSLSLCLPLWAATAAHAEGPAAKPAATTKAPAKPATHRQKLKNEAKGLALAAETVEDINDAQLAMAARVMTGTAACEFNQAISITAVEGHPGHFLVGHKGQRYRMTPRETSTGAVRLEDKNAGVVWIQIPAKSMLMNARAGQRMVDSCQLAEQRVAITTATATESGIGIVPQAAAARPQAAASAP